MTDKNTRLYPAKRQYPVFDRISKKVYTTTHHSGSKTQQYVGYSSSLYSLTNEFSSRLNEPVMDCLHICDERVRKDSFPD